MDNLLKGQFSLSVNNPNQQRNQPIPVQQQFQIQNGGVYNQNMGQYPMMNGNPMMMQPMMNPQAMANQNIRPLGNSFVREPSPKKVIPLKVSLIGKEHGYYSNMWTQAAQDNATVGGREAVLFFKKSGLPVDKLKQFWLIAAKTSNEYLTKDEFYVALKLIAYEQNGIKADENSLRMELQVSLPTFNGGETINTSTFSTVSSEIKAEIKVQKADDIALMLPDLDDIDINQINPMDSVLNPQKNAQKQQEMMQQQYMMQQQMYMMQQQQIQQQLVQQEQVAQPQEQQKPLDQFPQQNVQQPIIQPQQPIIDHETIQIQQEIQNLISKLEEQGRAIANEVKTQNQLMIELASLTQQRNDFDF